MLERYTPRMGRLRELLDDLARRRDPAPPTDDEQARDDWRNEGGQSPGPNWVESAPAVEQVGGSPVPPSRPTHVRTRRQRNAARPLTDR